MIFFIETVLQIIFSAALAFAWCVCYHKNTILKNFKEDVTMDILSYGIEQGMKQGLLAGKIESILEILGELGPVPEALKLRIQEQTDPEVLARWLKAALKSDSIKAFAEKI